MLRPSDGLRDGAQREASQGRWRTGAAGAGCSARLEQVASGMIGVAATKLSPEKAMTAAFSSAGSVFVIPWRMEMPIGTKTQGSGFSASDDEIKVEIRRLLRCMVIDVVEMPAKENVAGLDQVIDRNIHRNRTRAPRLPPFDDYLYRCFFQHIADRMHVR